MASLISGDYRLIGAVQGSAPDRWYRQCLDTRSPRPTDGSFALSCDCPAWINNQAGNRTCKHTRISAQLLEGQIFTNAKPCAEPLTLTTVRAMQPLIQSIGGAWRIEECLTSVAGAPYRFSLLEVVAADGPQASAFVAMNMRHTPHLQDVSAAVAAWGGWAVAAEIARLGGFAQVGAPPDTYYRFRRAARRDGPQHYGVHDLLTIGEQTDLGDGRTPRQRAEATLQMFLGPLYQMVLNQGYLDVSSRQYAGRVYRLRLDPARQCDRRVRVFEQGHYVRDLCIVRRDRLTPVQDGFLTVFLGLLSDEQQVLRVVGTHNIFSPYSDGREREDVPAMWVPKAA
jgi:hypothetical protein